MADKNTYQSQGQAFDQTIVSSYQNSQSSGQPASGQQQFTNTAGESQLVIGIFKSKRNAEQAVNQLRQQGFSNEEINIVSKQDAKKGDKEYVDDDISDGALTGGTLGGIGGLIIGAGALAIPGIGPIIAAGPIAAALSGAFAGGIAGGLIDWGIPAEVSHHYEREIAEGGTLAVIRTDARKLDQAAKILRQNGAQDVESHKQNDLHERK